MTWWKVVNWKKGFIRLGMVVSPMLLYPVFVLISRGTRLFLDKNGEMPGEWFHWTLGPLLLLILLSMAAALGTLFIVSTGGVVRWIYEGFRSRTAGVFDE